jgi:hypothetical protein
MQQGHYWSMRLQTFASLRGENLFKKFALFIYRKKVSLGLKRRFIIQHYDSWLAFFNYFTSDFISTD